MTGLNNGQLSLEYILLLCGFLAGFLLLLPSASQAFNASIFALDVSNAKNFLDDFTGSVEKLSVMGNGSRLSVEARPFNKWVLEVSETSATITVFGKDTEPKKIFSKLPVSLVSFSETMTERKSFSFAKGNGKILIVHNYSESG